jgi:hypothetical protein
MRRPPEGRLHNEGMTIKEALLAGKVPVGGADVAIGATYREVFEAIAGFPEDPEYRWEEPDGPGERFVMTAPFLGFRASRIEFMFVGGKLRMTSSDDPDDIADGMNHDVSMKRVTELIAHWTKLLGKPTRTFKDWSATWVFGGIELVVFYETRTPSVGMVVRKAIPWPP